MTKKPFHVVIVDENRRRETSGLTRDGFEVVPVISIKFSVQKPEPGGFDANARVHSRYGFNVNAVEKAVTRRMVQAGRDGSAVTHLPWNQLPAHLTINLWREYVRKFKFSELFTSEKISGLQTIEDMINQRMQEISVAELGDTGSPTGRSMPSSEAQHLYDRGIQVEKIKIHCIYCDPSLEEKIVQTWETNWLSSARKEQKQLEEWDALVETSAREEALKSFASLSSKPFSAKTKLSGNPFITLQLLFQNLENTIVTEHNVNSQLDEELRKMEEFSKWLKDNNAILAYGRKDKQP